MRIGAVHARRAGAAAIVLLLAVAGGYLVMARDDNDALPVEPAPNVPPADGVLGAVAPERVPGSVAGPTAGGLPVQEAAQPPTPRLDVVRIDAAGGALVAGRARVAAEVVLRLDGEPVATARADKAGNFVSLFDIPLTDAPRLLTIEALDAGGAVTPAMEDVIVAPARPPRPDAPARPVPTGEAFTSVQVSQRMADAESGGTPIEASAPADHDVTSFASSSVQGNGAAGAGAVVSVPPSGTQRDEEPGETLNESGDGQAEGAPLRERSMTVRAASVERGGMDEDPDPVPVASKARAAQGDADAPRAGTQAGRAGNPAAAADTDVDKVLPPVAPHPFDTRNSGAPIADAPIAIAAVPPDGPPRLFRTGPSGVRRIDPEPARPAVTETLELDAIAYDAGGDVQLSGRAAPDEALRIYLDDTPVRTARAGTDGTWVSPLPDVRTGVYTLRVDAVAADGRVTARVETPFQRAAPEIAAAARRDGVTAITVQPGFTLWAISRGWFGEGVRYVQIFEANRDQIRDPNLIYPGQVFSLPQAVPEPL